MKKFYGDVTRDDFQRRFLVQRNVATLGPFIRGKIRHELSVQTAHFVQNKTRLILEQPLTLVLR